MAVLLNSEMKEKCCISLLLNIILTNVIRPTTEKEIENWKRLEEYRKIVAVCKWHFNFNQHITGCEISKKKN